MGRLGAARSYTCWSRLKIVTDFGFAAAPDLSLVAFLGKQPLFLAFGTSFVDTHHPFARFGQRFQVETFIITRF
jgi:hypothetical protein